MHRSTGLREVHAINQLQTVRRQHPAAVPTDSVPACLAPPPENRYRDHNENRDRSNHSKEEAQPRFGMCHGIGAFYRLAGGPACSKDFDGLRFFTLAWRKTKWVWRGKAWHGGNDHATKSLYANSLCSDYLHFTARTLCRVR